MTTLRLARSACCGAAGKWAGIARRWDERFAPAHVLRDARHDAIPGFGIPTLCLVVHGVVLVDVHDGWEGFEAERSHDLAIRIRERDHVARPRTAELPGVGLGTRHEQAGSAARVGEVAQDAPTGVQQPGRFVGERIHDEQDELEGGRPLFDRLAVALDGLEDSFGWNFVRHSEKVARE